MARAAYLSFDSMTPAGRSIYVLATALFAGYAVWGSLIPFDFHRVPVAVASRMVLSDWTWEIADVVSNFLLFFPIGLFAAASFDRTHLTRFAPALIMAASVLLSLGVEIGQAFVSWRTPSILDVFAESSGAAAGVAACRRFGSRMHHAVDTATAAWRRAPLHERALWLYAAAFAWWWLFPFDFTLRPDEIWDKFHHQRLLLPFQPSPDAATALQRQSWFYAAFPLGLAAAVCGTESGRPRTVRRAFLLAASGLLLLGLAQVFVFSRTTDATLLVVTLPGAALGAATAARLARRRRTA
jgi:glycopeptide antibiotics resistance protein